MSLYKRNTPKAPVGVTEFEILKASHKFLRDEDEPESEQSQALTTHTNAHDKNTTDTKTWDDQLAAKYYASLYREFALCDLKHYKSGNFALRWRTEDEVLSGAGETTCGNTRCEHHPPPSSLSSSRLTSTSKVPLTTLELPFGYVEHGKSKSALVKVVLCGRCLKKLMWNRNKRKETQDDVDGVALGVQDEGEGGGDGDGDERGKQVRQNKVNSGRGEGPDTERRSGKSKRKKEEDSLSEEEKHQLVRRSRREDQTVGERHNHDSSYTGAPIHWRRKNEISDRVGKRRSGSYSKSRNGHPSHNSVFSRSDRPDALV